MLTREDNDLLTSVGPDTPMGAVFRRFWMPAAVSAELAADGSPLRLRILGENLLAFRNSAGVVGIVEPYCSHKLAPLFFGRNEHCGLRCVYHGWKYDVTGACVDMPNIDAVAAERLKPVARIQSYPVREAGGLVWVYLGPANDVPEIPNLEWIAAPAGAVHLARWLQRTNYAAGVEGDIDSSHISFLHGTTEKGRMSMVAPVIAHAISHDGAPVLQTKETDFGLTYGARRNTEDGRYYWRITHWLVPSFTITAGGSGMFGGTCLGTGRR